MEKKTSTRARKSVESIRAQWPRGLILYSTVTRLVTSFPAKDSPNRLIAAERHRSAASIVINPSHREGGISDWWLRGDTNGRERTESRGAGRTGVILTGQRFPSRQLGFDFQPHRSAPSRRREESGRSPRRRRRLVRHVVETIDLGLLLSGYATFTRTSSAKFFVYKAICHPEEPVGGCGKRCVGGGADTCALVGTALRVSLRVRVTRDVRVDARRTPICEIRSR